MMRIEYLPIPVAQSLFERTEPNSIYQMLLYDAIIDR